MPSRNDPEVKVTLCWGEQLVILRMESIFSDQRTIAMALPVSTKFKGFAVQELLIGAVNWRVISISAIIVLKAEGFMSCNCL